MILTACVADPDGSTAQPSTSAAAGALPAPGRTIEASPPAVEDLSGYRIAVVVPDDSEESEALLAAAREFAASSGADLEEYRAAAGDDPVGDALEQAVGADADLVVGLGAGVVSVFDFETGKILDQQVLVVGGQLAEPTANVTAVIWPGATSREPADEESVTVQRGVDALGAGIASIREGVTGVVLHLG
jgi:ethanolamine utilization protein EutA (predicted chaperonin)